MHWHKKQRRKPYEVDIELKKTAESFFNELIISWFGIFHVLTTIFELFIILLLSASLDKYFAEYIKFLGDNDHGCAISDLFNAFFWYEINHIWTKRKLLMRRAWSVKIFFGKCELVVKIRYLGPHLSRSCPRAKCPNLSSPLEHNIWRSLSQPPTLVIEINLASSITQNNSTSR